MKQTYEVTCARVGTVRIKAESRQEAMEKANTLPLQNIQWADDFEATDAEEADPYGTMGIDSE